MGVDVGDREGVGNKRCSMSECCWCVTGITEWSRGRATYTRWFLPGTRIFLLKVPCKLAES